MKRNTKTEKIIDVALEMLKGGGDYAVTMRQVASNSGMSLSNVQYYYKNKNELLKAMADRYFSSCLVELQQMEVIQSQDTIESDLKLFVRSLLEHGLEVSDMCRIFREYWAISTRNDEIQSHINQYYKNMVTILIGKLKTLKVSEKDKAMFTSILIPFVEGYSIVALSMPNQVEEVTESLTNYLISLINIED